MPLQLLELVVLKVYKVDGGWVIYVILFSGHGYFFHDTLRPNPTPTSIYYGHNKRAGIHRHSRIHQDFFADAIPQCRIEDIPYASDCDEMKP